MKINTLSVIFLLTAATSIFFISCDKDDSFTKGVPLENFEETSYEYFDIGFPSHFPPNFPSPEYKNDIATLGRVLFYDKELSRNNTVSCGTCHQQSKGFADGLAFSPGLFGGLSSRNTMSLANTAYQRTFFWDNNIRYIEEGVLKPIRNHVEMGMEDLSLMPEKLELAEYYNDLFTKAFGTPEINSERIATALAQFVTSIFSYQSKYDKGMESEFSNYTLSESNGKDLFFGKAGCANCHNSLAFTTKWGNAHNIGLDMTYSDEGFSNGQFKVPTLRNIEMTAPYMHDGRFTTLEEVVEHYNSGVKAHPYLSVYMKDNDEKPRRLNLEENEKKDLTAFLKTLTDYKLLNAPRFSDPF